MKIYYRLKGNFYLEVKFKLFINMWVKKIQF